ncbi:hypothetical protein Bca52824_013958 [Brassica carinata]|uniref:Uncharacterized protein n=1 Tax=Brassica carinata TaxID=52824 RepID=A0A8X7W1X8_BRACI|nr:hypothetical protein Bca52824_013958 [Brassica carinata]
MVNMVPPESSPLLGVSSYRDCSSGRGGFTEAVIMRREIINNQDSSGETAASTNYCSISPPPANKDDGSASKNDTVSYINIEDGNKDKSWLRLGIGPEEKSNCNSMASYQFQSCYSKNIDGKEISLELSLFSSSSNLAGPASSSVDNTQPQQPLNRSETLLNRGFWFPPSKPCIPQYTAPFRPSSLGMMSERDVTYNNSVTRSYCVGEGGAGPSYEFRVLDPPKRPHSGLWFLLQASQYQ